MKLRNGLLTIGIVLSMLSKVLQFRFGSMSGDVIIIPAAVLFVLAVLLSIPKFKMLLSDHGKKKRAVYFSVFCCLAVVSFQLFTMMTFGYSKLWGYVFIIPLIIFALSALVLWNKLTK